MTIRFSKAPVALAGALLLAACQTTTGDGTQTAATATASSGAGAPAVAELAVAFADPAWTGERIPPGQQCAKFGGHGSTPPLIVSGLPEGTTQVVVAFNDANYRPLATDGGHGKIGVAVPAGASNVTVPPVRGGTATMPDGVTLVARNRATGSYAQPGYLPPCSGGRGNTYFAEVTARDETMAVLGAGRITLGRY